MAVTTQQSTQTANAAAGVYGTTFLNPAEQHAKVRIARIDFTQSGAGDVGSTVDLCRLPAGKVRLLGDMSLVAVSAWGTARTLAIGWTAYTGADGSTANAATPAGLTAATSVASAVKLVVGTAAVLGNDQTKLFDSAGGVLIQAIVAGDTIPDGATITGYVAYAKD
jgi:hypothetical protein